MIEIKPKQFRIALTDPELTIDGYDLFTLNLTTGRGSLTLVKSSLFFKQKHCETKDVVIYINDMPESVKSSLYMFADDTKAFREIVNPIDKDLLQNDLNSLSKWSQDWLIQFHPEKCSVLHLRKDNPHNNYIP